MATFIIRPSNSEKEAFRIKLTATSLLGLRMKSGDLCSLNLASTSPHDASQTSATDRASAPESLPAINDEVSHQRRSLRSKFAIVWEASGTGMKDGVVQMSKFLQDLYELRLGDKVVIERSHESLRGAETVRLADRGIGGVEGPLNEDERKFWARFVQLSIGEMTPYVVVGQRLEFRLSKERRVFDVVDAGAEGMDIGKVSEGTTFVVVENGSTDTSNVEFTGAGIGGLKKEVDEMQKLVTRLISPKIPTRYSPVQGVLVYGAKGVGKSHFINQLAASGWSSIIHWTPGSKTPTPIRHTLIILNQLDLPSSQASSRSILREIDRLFSQIRDTPCLLIGETRHPNDVDAYLRSEGKFSVELEIPIPSAPQRHAVLLAMRDTDPIPSDELIQQTSDRTHGYVAADLKALLRRMLELASESFPLSNGIPESSPPLPTSSPPIPTPSEIHLLQALTQIRPSALQEIFLETPNTRWTDIGGHTLLKRQLQNAVSRPLTSASRMARLKLKPKKGVLLYGPPGCSKTLLVRALANEASLNFLAVKGAELVSMYVGESERATREIFRKARAASPSILFFDEIDAIASRGGRGTTSTAGSGGGGGSDLNVLTTLLNEMDGFEELKGVFVVAATNRPGAIDPALLRPGRFDSVVYVGPPDEATRSEIFAQQFRGSSYVVVPLDGSEAVETSVFVETSAPIPTTPTENPIPGDESATRQSGTNDISNPNPNTTNALLHEAIFWARKTPGFSGAEIVGICQTAKELALDEDRDEWNSNDVRKAVEGTPKSITREMVEGFERWNAQRMG